MADSNSTPRPFKCTSCDNSFTRQENLKRHVNTHHKGFNAKSFQCTQCDARFARSDLRKRHIENCHVTTQTLPKAPVGDPVLAHVTVDSSSSSSAWLATLLATPTVQRTSRVPAKQNTLQLEYEDPGMSRELQCVDSFFLRFHRNFPILHEASFHVISAPAPLLSVITCIGSLYSLSGFTEASRKALFQSTLTSMQTYVEQNRSRYQEIWVLQTFLLLEFLGIYGGDDSNFLKAQRIHRDLVDAVRMLQMCHDGSSTSPFEDPSDELEEGSDDNGNDYEREPLEHRWQDFIKRESRKRCIYTLYLLDSQMSIVCNLRPMLSSLEIKYDLPCCEDMWLAKTAEDWSTCQKNQFKSFDDHDDQVYSQESPPSPGSFYEASQTLLHPDSGKKKPRKLRLLWASPFAAVILVTQLQMMARELTHASCLLERPRAQRRSLCVLTDKQYAQISQALKGIVELVPRNQRPVFDFFDFRRMDTLTEPEEATPLWHTFWVLWYYTSITLSHPDSLLTSGIVESNLPLAIATAGHLATPRSKDKRDIYDDGDVFRILNDLELALEVLNPMKSTTLPTLESPFITLLGFKICLVGWRLVRLTMGQAGDTTNHGVRSNPCKFVLDAIMACVDTSGDVMILDHAVAPPRDTARAEVQFLEWIVESFKKRASWPAGEWISAVMKESMAKAIEAYQSSIS